MTSTTRRRIIGLLLATSFIGVACASKPKAPPPPPPDPKVEFKAGQVQFNLGNFDKAIAHFTRAYEAEPLPAFLFNIGQCHWHVENYEKAIFFFKGYLREVPEAPNRATVEQFIAESEAKLGSGEKTD